MVPKNIFVYPRYPENLLKLIHLSYNLWTLWDADAVRIFYRMDPELFRSLDRNPVAFLHSIPEEKLQEFSKDKSFLDDLEKVWEKYEAYEENKTDYHDRFKDVTIAYFSMEYALHQSIPIYAGGLGILSGDYLKGASDLDMPVVGIGLFYTYGYFTQRINLGGNQEELYKENLVHYIPVKEFKTIDGKPVYITVDILNTPVKVKVWSVRIGKLRLLLLDTNIEENPAEYRGITDHLYVANKDNRIMQEIVLGFGGMRVLEAAGIRSTIFHINEGHSAFLILDRLSFLINREKLSFKEAYALIKNTTVFTTHTPVEEGNENYPVELIKKYLENEVKKIGIGFEDFLRYGKLSDGTNFWLPAFAIRFSKYVNGVSKLHSEVSRNMWSVLFPHRDIREVPIIGITNAVHWSWLSNEMQELFESYLGANFVYERGNDKKWERILNIPDEEVWEAHLKGKREMISFLRKSVGEQYVQKGYSMLNIKKVQEMLNARYLTIGFARRFVSYKRPTLIIRDKERLKKILSGSEKPIQLIFAGKAHPADEAGKKMIKEIIDFKHEFEVEDRVVFIENYSRDIAVHLVQGVDLWLNTPVKTLEASGTSGIKAGINGALNLSILDGWWPECYNRKNGWAITAGEVYTDPENRDSADADQMYDLLEEEISTLYYDRDEIDIPRQWVQMMKESIYTIYKSFNINRMLNEYCEKFYLPAAQKGMKLLENKRSSLKGLVKRSEAVSNFWEKIYIKDAFTDIDQRDILFINDKVHIECFVYLDDIDPSLIDVEIFYSRERDNGFEVVKLNFVDQSKDKIGKYAGDVVLTSPGVQNIRIRLVPADEDIQLLYPDLIKWREI